MIIAFRDIDNKNTLKEVLENCRNQINTLPDVKCDVADDWIRASNGAAVKIIELGLADDKDLSSVGITEGAVEDYLLKLLVMDSNVQKWARVSLRDLRDHLEPFKNVKGIELNKSKPFISMLASLKRMTYQDCVKKLIELADKDNVKTVTKDVVKHLFSS